MSGAGDRSLSLSGSFVDRFGTSLSYPAPEELAYHELSGANAVVLQPHGFVYLGVPSFADDGVLRQAALASVQHAGVLVEPAYCLRVLPPLDCLPATQFVVTDTQDGMTPGLVDLRPVHGGIAVVEVPPHATPSERIAVAVRRYGEPVAARPLHMQIARGHARVLHRGHAVDAHTPLYVELPAPLVVVPRNTDGGSSPRLSSAARASDADAHTLPRSSGLGSFPAQPSSAPHTQMLGTVFCLLWGHFSGLDWLVALSCYTGAWAMTRQVPQDGADDWAGTDGVASVEAHRSLARALATLELRDTLAPRHSPTALAHLLFNFCVWSPESFDSFQVRGDALAHDFDSQLWDSRVTAGRGRLEFVEPPYADTCVHFVASSREPSLVTVLADIGTARVCLDVSREKAGASLLQAMQLLYPALPMRISAVPRSPLRHGDIVLVQIDRDSPQQEIGTSSLVPTVWQPELVPGTELVYITAADLGLLQLVVPQDLTPAAIGHALLRWLGRQRCLGVGLHTVRIAGVPERLFCLPRRYKSSLTAVLSDIDGFHFPAVVTTVDCDGAAPLTCAHLRDGHGTSGFWADVLARTPACLHSTTSRQSPHQGPHVCFFMGLDGHRAVSTGWSPRRSARPARFDLFTYAREKELDWFQVAIPSYHRHTSTQTTAAYWPVAASPLFSASMPVPSRADGCSFLDDLSPGGTLFQLPCPHMHVRCVLPCVPGYRMWALRFNNWVYAACTATITWHHVLQLSGLSSWDLPEVRIHGLSQTWDWPEDVASLDGQCGHLLKDGHEMCRPQGKAETSIAGAYSEPFRPPVAPPEGTEGPFLAPESGVIAPLLWLHWVLCGSLSIPRRHVAAYAVGLLILARGQTSSDGETCPNATLQVDSTAGCTTAWCHELSCQNTHFGVDTVALSTYFAANAPFDLVRLQLWLPFQGPITFDVSSTIGAHDLGVVLYDAGHRPLQHSLFVASDTHSTVLDLLSVPAGDNVWWIVRDGLARELLRPVGPWYEGTQRLAVTINSHGQAVSLAASPECAAMRHYPQGVRGTVAVPLTRVYGHVTASGLVLAEASIGILGACMGKVVGKGASILLLAVLAGGMQQEHMLARRQPAASWGSAPAPPDDTYVWTHTLSSPLVVPFEPQFNPAALARRVEATGRGVHAEGVFDWTIPQQVHASAHVLHYPARASQQIVYWLLHYRGRGCVYCAVPGNLDWQLLGRDAAEAFGVEGLSRGLFGIENRGRIYAYGSPLVAPPHGTILHLMRVNDNGPQAAALTWDEPAPLTCVPQFDYSICRGPRGEAPIIWTPELSSADRLSSRDGQVDTLVRLESMVACLQADMERLLLRVPGNTAPTGDGAAVPSVEHAASPPVSKSASHGRLGLHSTIVVWVLLPLLAWPTGAWPAEFQLITSLGLLSVWSVGVIADDEEERSPTGPTEPSSPDLTDINAPTPTAEVVTDVATGSTPHIRMSDSGLSSTSAPVQGELAGPDNLFSSAQVPQMQCRVAACLYGVEAAPAPQPFIPRGCPFTIHNPFARNLQCQVLSTIVYSPYRFREILQDYVNRRGWQPLVCVQPQPDSDSVHLIPMAADSGLASVVFRSNGHLYPACVQRALPRHPYASIQLNGRHARIREPYQLSRQRGQALMVRDGDCLHADPGPFGPPPPVPADTATSTTGIGVMMAVSFRWYGLAVLFLSVADAVQILPIAPPPDHPTRYRPGYFPWRESWEQRRVAPVCSGTSCHTSLLCPWTGPQGVFSCAASLPVQEMWRRYSQHGLYADFMPVWPSLDDTRLWLVPRAPLGSGIVSVVCRNAHLLRAIFLPQTLTITQLCQSVQYLTGWEVGQVRSPPAAYARLCLADDSRTVLRDGDVLDVLACRADCHPYELHRTALLKDHVLWTRACRLHSRTAIFVWQPGPAQPILTWLEAGSAWDPTWLTFDGSFHDRFPGMWVPVIWSPSPSPHLIKVADTPGRVHVLAEDSTGARCLSVRDKSTLGDLADAFHADVAQLVVLGLNYVSIDEPLPLRNGDVIVDKSLYTPRDTVWPELRRDQHISQVSEHSAAPRSQVGCPWFLLLACTFRCRSLGARETSVSASVGTGLGAAVGRMSAWPWAAGPHFLGLCLFLWGPSRLSCFLTALFSPVVATRSRSPSPLSRRAPTDDSFHRLGHWRPDAACPVRDVMRGTHSIAIVSPSRSLLYDSSLTPTFGTWLFGWRKGDGPTFGIRPSRLVSNAVGTGSRRGFVGRQRGCNLSFPAVRRPMRDGSLSPPFQMIGQMFFLTVECRQLLLQNPGPREEANLVPPDWQLRSDIQEKVVYSWPRDGDVMVPRFSGPAARSGAAVLCLFSRAPWVARLVLLWGCLAGGVGAMHAPPAEQQQLPAVRVGKFPWRLPGHLRACHESVGDDTDARLLSPFSGLGDSVPVSPDTTVTDLTDSISGGEPPWFQHAVPVWPSLWPSTLVLVPVPDYADLVCVVIAAPEWQLAALVPRRGGRDWTLNCLRRCALGPLWSIRAPLSAQTPGASGSQPVNWRNGDVLLAFQYHSDAASYTPPQFTSPSHVRHAAIWSSDFWVQCDLPIVMWRPGSRPSRTVAPAPQCWIAHDGTFYGTFSRRYPGRWVPMPWAYSDEVHLCLRSEDAERCNVILEYQLGGKLLGDCYSVRPESTGYSLSYFARAPVGELTLLGQPVGETDFPPLRDGDIIHYETAHAWRGSHSPIGLVLVGLLTRHFSVRGFGALALGGLGFCWSDGFMTGPGQGSSSVRHHLGASGSVTDALLRRQHSLPFGRSARRIMSWALGHLRCYLAARGAPACWKPAVAGWELDLQEVFECQASLHDLWWGRQLCPTLPPVCPYSYHLSWEQYPTWSGGVPDAVLLATDGSGDQGGSWAFVAWCRWKHRWYRIGWAAAPLARTPWQHTGAGPYAAQCSFVSELTALQAAAAWCNAAFDFWKLHMGSCPGHVTVAVDNASALQVASGVGTARGTWATTTRLLWQCVQGRASTDFKHVHSHQGTMVNTLADALAGHAHCWGYAPCVHPAAANRIADQLANVGHLLWAVPRATLLQGRPVLVLPYFVNTAVETHADDAPANAEAAESADDAAVSVADRPATQPLSLQVLTANVQSMRDAKFSFFNPSGHAARRQYLLRQVSAIPCDILCIQEARSMSGRWNTGGWLSWRSGHDRGQYGCEIWIRPDLLSPPLTLNSWRIVVSQPRILVITCLDERLPLTVCSAHAPHAERPTSEARSFWHTLQEVLLRRPRHGGLLLGIDANADLFAQDEHESLIGTRLAAGEPERNDLLLLDFCVQLSLVAPATHEGVQKGPGWSWEHASGRRKRLDHILFQAGPWEMISASQALDLDIVNTCKDHVPLRVSAVLRCPGRSAPPPAIRRCTREEVLAQGESVWAKVRHNGRAEHGPAERVRSFLQHHQEWCRGLPRRSPPVVRQPYLCQRTVHALLYLRDWRCQVRQVGNEHRLWQLCRAFLAWRGSALPTAMQAAMRDTRRLLAALQGQEAHLARRVHDLARRDKHLHFLSLTKTATDAWHAHGRPLEAIQKLRWASRRAAERRAVHAAGGYDIDAQLEEQFRAQEGGRLATPAQARSVIDRWLAEPARPCHSALPSKLALEFACRQQKVGKAPGPDSVTNAFWALFLAYAGEWLWEVCTRIALSGREPAHFKAALVCALYKKGPAALPQNYRSIALLNGVAKLWHGHLRRTIGGSVLQAYDPLQLDGRRGIPVGFAVATYRAATELSVLSGRSVAVLFIDIQAAYYEASRSLVFTGGPLDDVPDCLPHHHLQALATELLQTGALERLGVPAEERALLQDCVSCSYWRLVSSDRLYIATRGSRPGDGLADIIFGALFSVALRHIRGECLRLGIGHSATGQVIGSSDDLLALGWADDLALITDYDSPADLLQLFPTVAGVALSTLRALKFRVNLGAGKTEALLDIRGIGAKHVRAQLLAGASAVVLGPGLEIRVAPEYRYLGVIQTPHDTGRRDTELSAQRAYGAWAHGKTLLSSTSVPWALRVAWLAGRILPAAYATLATSLATSARAWAPLEGFFEKAVRSLSGSWMYGHFLSKPTLLLLAGLSTPRHAADVARVRLVVQLVTRSPPPVYDVFDAAWNRATPWCETLAMSLRRIAVGLRRGSAEFVASFAYVRQHARELVRVCRRLSRWGTLAAAFVELWQDVVAPRQKKVLGPSQMHTCSLCGATLPSYHAWAAHMHRKHAIVNQLTRLTSGTACLWCHTEHHSTDRLKYHLKVSPACVHGLRVTVGEVYARGSGTKRSGPRAHRGLPPVRLIGPLNATPAQRAAALEGRTCSRSDLDHELFAATGATAVYEWPEAPSCAHMSTPPPCASTAAGSPSPSAPLSGLVSRRPGSHTPCAHTQSGRWFALHDCSAVRADDWQVPSPRWEGLLQGAFACQLPHSWHKYWRCWSAAVSHSPWSHDFYSRTKLLRLAHDASPQGSSTGPPAPMLDLLAATVALRTITHAMQHSGLLWIRGSPSRTGLSVLRSLLPEASFHSFWTPTTSLFVAAHPTGAPPWRRALSDLFSVSPSGHSPCILQVRASLIYRTRSLDVG
ncbi:unnamed protein product [Symbiodinium microadriaticum]|nr:unnamed protein product [Symbiodinium microadriaticum]